MNISQGFKETLQDFLVSMTLPITIIMVVYSLKFVQLKLNQQLMAIDSDHNLDINEKMKRKQSLLLMHGIHIGSPGSASMIMGLSPATSAMSPLAPSFYPPGDTVESVIGKSFFMY